MIFFALDVDDILVRSGPRDRTGPKAFFVGSLVAIHGIQSKEINTYIESKT